MCTSARMRAFGLPVEEIKLAHIALLSLKNFVDNRVVNSVGILTGVQCLQLICAVSILCSAGDRQV